MFESVIVALLKQAATLTRPQQDEFIAKAADAVAVLVRDTDTMIDDVIVQEIILPMGVRIIDQLGARLS